jgi:8-oxo-dGTP pyrophosphatase MutT (NUDIX family)
MGLRGGLWRGRYGRPVTRYSLIPAAYVYLVRDGRVLLQLRHNTGYMDGFWTAGAAGHLEPGETAVQAATREISEELGVRVPASELVPSAVMQRTDGTSDPREQRVDWFFTCSSWSGEPSIMEPEKCAELGWFDLMDLPAQIPAYERTALVWLRDNDSVGLLAVGF